MTRAHVLVVDDDTDIRALLRELLERRGFSVAEAADGRDALRAFYGAPPDVVLLDVGMPGMDGWHDARAHPRPQRRAGRDADCARRGAGEDARPPRRGRRLRHEAVRPPGAPGEDRGPAPTLGRPGHCGGRVVLGCVRDDRLRAAQRHGTGAEVALTPLEFKLLTAFVRHPNQVLSNEQLLVLVWGESDASREQVKLYVGYLRRKLSPDAPDEAPIETRRGFGYAYRPGRGG